MYPLVTACVPVYNHEEYVADTLESIMAQTYRRIELIIINDGSTDKSNAIVESFVEKCNRRFVRFKYINRENRGLCNTINEALVWSEGKYFASLASDDQWLANKTKTQVDYLESMPTAAGVFGGIDFIDEKSKYIRSKCSKFNSYKFKDIFLLKAFLPAPTAMLRIENLVRSGGFDSGTAIEDWSMWLKLTASGVSTLDFLNQILAKYRRHGRNISKQLDVMREEQEKILCLYKDHEFYGKARQFVALSQFNGMVIHDKSEAIKLIPEFAGLWHDVDFLKAMAKIAIPQKRLKAKYA